MKTLHGQCLILPPLQIPLQPHTPGSLIDIVNPGNRLRPNHSWHLDANLEQATVMFGFPRADHYKGAGVFSHAVQLSHQLRDQVPGGAFAMVSVSVSCVGLQKK
jgi:hypothetical protein